MSQPQNDRPLEDSAFMMQILTSLLWMTFHQDMFIKQHGLKSADNVSQVKGLKYLSHEILCMSLQGKSIMLFG